MINTKYYIILLISVFLTLGIGIIVGISLQSKDVLEKQHNIIAHHLENEFNGIRIENRKLREALTLLEDSEIKNKTLYESMFNSTIKNKLQGLKVALIEIGDDQDSSGLIDLLKISGASIESNITFNPKLFSEDYEPDDSINVLSQEGWNKDIIWDNLPTNLIESLAEGEYTVLTKELNALDLIYSPIDLKDSCDSIIISYGNPWDNTKKMLSKFNDNLVKLSLERNIPVILAENQDTNLIDFEQYKQLGIPTVHHIDALHGKLALISLLYGSEGNYGYAEKYDGVLPEELFPSKPVYDPDEEYYEKAEENMEQNEQDSAVQGAESYK
ncbi:MAG: copper transporter [Clostridiales bacterium]|nr:copper transporter [Clostridiales bacterium]